MKKILYIIVSVLILVPLSSCEKNHKTFGAQPHLPYMRKSQTINMMKETGKSV